MGSKVLAELVTRVISTGCSQKLSEQQAQQFHKEFRSEVSEKIESMRVEKRRAYDEIKNVVLR